MPLWSDYQSPKPLQGALSDPVPFWVVENAAARAKQAAGPAAAAASALEERAASERAKVLAAPPAEGNYMYARGDSQATVYFRMRAASFRSVRLPLGGLAGPPCCRL